MHKNGWRQFGGLSQGDLDIAGMDMGVNEPRQKGFPLNVYHLFFLRRLERASVLDIDDFSVLDEDTRIRLRIFAGAVYEQGVVQNQGCDHDDMF